MNNKLAVYTVTEDSRAILSGSHEQIKWCFKTLLTSQVTDHVMGRFISVEKKHH